MIYRSEYNRESEYQSINNNRLTAFAACPQCFESTNVVSIGTPKFSTQTTEKGETIYTKAAQAHSSLAGIVQRKKMIYGKIYVTERSLLYHLVWK